MCEEVQSLQLEVPRAMVLSVTAAGVTGIIYLLLSIVRRCKAVKQLSFSLGKGCYALNASVVFAGFATISVTWFFVRGKEAWHSLDLHLR